VRGVLGIILLLVASVASAQPSLTASATTVPAGGSYTLTVSAYGDDIHVVKLDGEYPFMGDAICDGPPEGPTTTCTKTVIRTASGSITHRVTSIHQNGVPWPDQTVAVTVTGGGTAWSTPLALTSGGVVYAHLAADGTSVHVAQGDGTVYYRRSLDEGLTWSAWQILGPGKTYLEKPVAVQGSLVVVAPVRITRIMTDFAGARPVGDVWAHVSRDGGASFLPAMRISGGEAAFRVSASVEGSTIHLAWMDYRRGQWDVYLRSSFDGGLTWEPEWVIAAGVNASGEQRPSLAQRGDRVGLATMSGGDSQPACAIEGGTTLPNCTVIRVRVSNDGGRTFGAPQRVTPLGVYGGRPSVAILPSGAFLVAYDTILGGDSEIGLVRSLDGATWLPVQRLTAVPGVDTHATPVVGAGSSATLVWRGTRGSSTYAYASETSDDGATWTNGSWVSTQQMNVPTIGASTAFRHVLATEWMYGRLLYSRTAGGTGGAVPPPQPPDPCVVDPTGVLWPTDPAVQQATVTDDRGCVRTVTR